VSELGSAISQERLEIIRQIVEWLSEIEDLPQAIGSAINARFWEIYQADLGPAHLYVGNLSDEPLPTSAEETKGN
jgi:hypothetical protein